MAICKLGYPTTTKSEYDQAQITEEDTVEHRQTKTHT